MTQQINIQKAEGKLGILLVGLGAVSTTFIAGVEAAKKKVRKPIGSLTQMGNIRLGKRTENKTPMVKDFVPLAKLEDIVYGAWDLFPDTGYEAALKAGVIPKDLLVQIKDDLSELTPMPAVFDKNFIRKLEGSNVKNIPNKMDQATAVIKDIENFRTKSKVNRLTMIWCGSTEAYCTIQPEHKSIKAFEEALKNNSPNIPPSMIYAYAAIKCGIGYANGAPNLTTDCPAILDLANEHKVPVSGKDFKTGQTLMKTIIAPGLRARYLGISGWFSTNILGNRDGEVLDDPANFKTKEESKLGVLDTILQPHLYPDLYGDLYHKVRIEYYPPRRDNKEGWDNIDLVGWLGMPMQLKIDFLCRDSILAAPLVLDLVLFMDLAQRAGLKGIQEWLSFYYKSPMTAEGLYPEHNLFIQEMKLKNTLRYMMGEEQITHLGLDYYQ
ncbi:MAG: inositol-3-phosphate synthase [Deltaproteobacteria bacterium GWA2_45_12]|nr:MAG: inositol-3-phosphate synthase [Deltaproteobacteria bacterium GWA2_45_12]